MSLVLASSSPFRQELLARLKVAFEVWAPCLDESPLPGESPEAQALRLARAKALAVAARLGPHAFLVLGSDQVAALGSKRLGKPATRTRAIEQLWLARGQEITFYTAAALFHAPRNELYLAVVPSWVRLRKDLTQAEIERYVDREEVLGCAGSAKIEGLGIALLDAVQSSDPTALIGLPLITIARWLRRFGIAVP